MARILNFHHAGLCVPKEKYEEAKEFYVKVLGYEVKHEAYERDTHYADLKHKSGTWLEVVDLPESMPELNASDDAIFEHICYEVDDIYGFIDLAVSHGAKVLFGPIPAQFCARQDILVAYILGITGEAIEITQNV